MSKEPMMETVPIEKSVPVSKSVPVYKSIPIPKSVPVEKSVPIPEAKSMIDKMIAVEYGRASHAGVTKAAEMAPAEAAKVPAEMPPAETASVAAVHGGRAQGRAGRDNRHSGQCYRYFPHHDVHSVSCHMHPSIYERSAVAIAFYSAAPLLDVAAPVCELRRSV